METVYLCVGNGLHANGKASKISEQIIKEALAQFDETFTLPDLKSGKIIFSGGYKNASGVTEAQSMMDFARQERPGISRLYRGESESYRTHNNAIYGLELIHKLFGHKNVMIHIFDHPAHIERTAFAFNVVNRIYHKSRYTIMPWPVSEVYDSEIPGQPYWVSRKEFAKRERWMKILYYTFLFRPWSRIGLWLLVKIWPSHKQ